ncbi:MAG: DMT family transporter [Pseudomonadota bacterium]
MPETPQRPIAGILWMLLAGLSFVGVTGIVKHVGAEMPAEQAAFLRFLFGMVFFLPFLGRLARLRMTARLWRLNLWRGGVHTVAVLLWFFAMTRITMAEVTALNYLNPICVTLGAVLLLGERIALRRILAVGVALIGAMVILRPGFRELDLGHLSILGAALFLAMSYLLTKVLSAEMPAEAIVAIMSVLVTIMLAPFAIAVWTPPTLEQLIWTLALAGVATLGHYAMTRAFRAAPLTVTQPVTFLQLVWSVVLGWAVFGEAVDLWVIVGGVMIVGSATFIAIREAQARREVTPNVNATKV